MRIFLQVSYDGTAFHGSQIQGEQPTVQYFLNKALSTLLRKETATYGASRTDEGVHALCNYYHFDIDLEPAADLQYRLNAILPKTIAVTDLLKVKEGANCRFDAISRKYRYKLHFRKDPFLLNRSCYFPFRFDKEVLHITSDLLLQYEDFATFSKRNTQSFTSLCRMMESYWTFYEDRAEYVVRANRFLRGMVRALVGTQLQVARGSYDVEELRRRVTAKDCSLADFSVPGHGLYLEEITYPADYFVS